jgi:hypothetical protein
MTRMRRFRSVEWEAVAGVVAAVIALVLHLLGVADVDVLLTVMLVLLALLLLSVVGGQGREQRVGGVFSGLPSRTDLSPRSGPPTG